VQVLPDAAAVAEHVARLFADLLDHRPDAVLGLATGATPIPIYRRLVAQVRHGRLSFRQAASFNLDEYVGIGADHPASFRHAMQRHLFDHVDLDPARAHVPDGSAADLEAEAARYEHTIRQAGGIDLQLLGIGRNGHIGFNEPGSALDSRTRVVTLAPATRAANRRAFPPGETVPTRALTMGIGTILEARAIVLVATGAAKASAVAAALEGPVAPSCPASALQAHRGAAIICDAAAASGLTGLGRR
jgi:glucosamine-6-phosphate deaminase